MAYDKHTYRSPSQNSAVSLSSSISCLDGVPFKIGTAFRPPQRAILPPELMRRPQPCDALSDEYSYETEEAVLAWARAREEAKLKAAAERETTEKARAALAAGLESTSSSDSEEDVPDAPAPQVTQLSGGAETSGEQVHVQPVKPPWQLPLATPVSSTILMPMPIQAQVKKIQSPAGAPRVDLALFEQEADPFDNLELQTINDMEELRNVLDGSNIAGTGQAASKKVDTDVTKKDNQGETSHSANSGNYVSWALVSQPRNAASMSVSETGKSEDSVENNADNPATGNNQDSTNAKVLPQGQHNSQFTFDTACDGEYVEIRPGYSKQSVSFQRDNMSVQSAGPVTNTSFGGELPSQFAASKLFKPVLPPIVRPRSESLGVAASDIQAGTYSNSFTPVDTSVYQNANSFNKVPSAMSQSAYVPSASSANMHDMSRSEYTVSNSHYSNIPNTSMGFGAVPASNPLAPSDGFGMNSFSNNHQRAGFEHVSSMPVVNGVDTGNTGGLRNARSNPDLSLSREPWNPYKPLPPTPQSHSPDMRSASSSSGSPSPDLRRSPGPRSRPITISVPTAAVASAELDPYNSLSHENKIFVNNLTCMGFSRSRAARAVKKFGADEREVLDHLLNVDKLVEKKFKPELAETGLQLFRNDIKKAEQFLDLYQQFTELGFTGERIQTALVKHQLDRDKALDYLTT